MKKKDSIKVLLLTAICVAAFVGFVYIALCCPMVGVYGMLFFAVYPRIKNAYQKSKENDNKDGP